MKVVAEINTFGELYDSSWSGARDVLKEVAEQGRQEEVMDLLEELFSDITPSDTDVNDYIWFQLADDLDLYNEDEEEE